MSSTTEQPTIVAPTVEQIQTDRITLVSYIHISNYIYTYFSNCMLLFQLAEKYWAPQSAETHVQFDPDVIEDIYMQDIRGSK